jgi:hypothetical protein
MPSGAKPKIYAKALVNRVAALYSSGMTQHEVAAEIGISQKIVWNVMRRSGIRSRAAIKRDQLGDKNHKWKGDDASKQAFHRRLYARHGKPTECAVCGTKTAKVFDYANLTGKYHRLDDYAPMCRSCHAVYDGKWKNFLGRCKEVTNA